MTKNLIIFDLDGVLFDSKKNMEISWNFVKKKYQLKIKFESYFRNIGMPFLNILKKLGISKNQIKINRDYIIESKKNKKKIKIYKGVKKILQYLKKKNNFLAVVTSKDKIRTKLLIKKYKLDFDYISCPTKKLRGKPHPDQLNMVIKRLKVAKEKTIYLGDTKNDYLAANRAGIQFYYASYGYGNLKKSKKFTQINSISGLKKFY